MIKQGQTIYLSGGFRNLKGKPFEVSKVGKKYFYVKCHGKDLAFDITTKCYMGDTNYPYIVWENLQDYEHKQEMDALIFNIQKNFNHFKLKKLSLSDLQTINKIFIIHD